MEMYDSEQRDRLKMGSLGALTLASAGMLFATNLTHLQIGIILLVIVIILTAAWIVREKIQEGERHFFTNFKWDELAKPSRLSQFNRSLKELERKIEKQEAANLATEENFSFRNQRDNGNAKVARGHFLTHPMIEDKIEPSLSEKNVVEVEPKFGSLRFVNSVPDSAKETAKLVFSKPKVRSIECSSPSKANNIRTP